VDPVSNQLLLRKSGRARESVARNSDLYIIEAVLFCIDKLILQHPPPPILGINLRFKELIPLNASLITIRGIKFCIASPYSLSLSAFFLVHPPPNKAVLL
jgi:hypothetical protein